MKVGDKFPVTLAGHIVTQAQVREVGDGTAVLVIPGVAVTMAVRTELDSAPAPEKETETVITGADRVETTTDREGNEGTVESTETVVTTTGAPTGVDPAENVTSPEGGTGADPTDPSPTQAATSNVEPAAPVEAPTSDAPVESNEQA